MKERECATGGALDVGIKSECQIYGYEYNIPKCANC
jgi:hypothetical protein